MLQRGRRPNAEDCRSVKPSCNFTKKFPGVFGLHRAPRRKQSVEPEEPSVEAVGVLNTSNQAASGDGVGLEAWAKFQSLRS